MGRGGGGGGDDAGTDGVDIRDVTFSCKQKMPRNRKIGAASMAMVEPRQRLYSMVDGKSEGDQARKWRDA